MFSPQHLSRLLQFAIENSELIPGVAQTRIERYDMGFNPTVFVPGNKENAAR
jgi:hypothetical protein